MTRETLNCARCGKRLSQKTARQIDGVPVCSACMFGQTDTVASPPQGGKCGHGIPTRGYCPICYGHTSTVPTNGDDHG